MNWRWLLIILFCHWGCWVDTPITAANLLCREPSQIVYGFSVGFWVVLMICCVSRCWMDGGRLRSLSRVCQSLPSSLTSGSASTPTTTLQLLLTGCGRTLMLKVRHHAHTTCRPWDLCSDDTSVPCRWKLRLRVICTAILVFRSYLNNSLSWEIRCSVFQCLLTNVYVQATAGTLPTTLASSSTPTTCWTVTSSVSIHAASGDLHPSASVVMPSHHGTSTDYKRRKLSNKWWHCQAVFLHPLSQVGHFLPRTASSLLLLFVCPSARLSVAIFGLRSAYDEWRQRLATQKEALLASHECMWSWSCHVSNNLKPPHIRLNPHAEPICLL